MFLKNQQIPIGPILNENNEVLVNDGSLEDLLDTSKIESIPETAKKVNPKQLNLIEKEFYVDFLAKLQELDWDRRMIVAKSLFREVLKVLDVHTPKSELWGMVQSSVDHTNGLLQHILNQNDESFMSRIKAENESMRAKLNSIKDLIND
jgi:hypothetical protein